MYTFNQKNILWVECTLQFWKLLISLMFKNIEKGLKTLEKKNVNIKVEFSMTFIIYEVSSKRSNALSDL